MVDRHPQLRERFRPGRRSWRGYHRPAILAAGGLILAAGGLTSRHARAFVLGAAAVAPYGWYRLGVQPVDEARRNRLRLFFPMLIVDAAEAAVVTATEARLRLRSLLNRTS